MAHIVWCSVEIYPPCLHSVATVGMESVLDSVDIVKNDSLDLDNYFQSSSILSKWKKAQQLSDI